MARRTKLCPFCAETVKYEAIVCKHCKRDIPKTGNKKARKSSNPDQIKPYREFIASEFLKSYRTPPEFEKIWKRELARLRKVVQDEPITSDYTPVLSESRNWNTTKFQKHLNKYYKESWQQGGEDPMNAARWLNRNPPGLLSGNEVHKAHIIVQNFWYKRTRESFQDKYTFQLERLLGKVVSGSKNRRAAEKRLSIIEERSRLRAPDPNSLEYSKEFIDLLCSEARKLMDGYSNWEASYTLQGADYLDMLLGESERIAGEIAKEFLKTRLGVIPLSYIENSILKEAEKLRADSGARALISTRVQGYLEEQGFKINRFEGL